MIKKGLDSEITINHASKFVDNADEPFHVHENKNKKVDVNVLKARVQRIQDKENKKNIISFVFFFILMGVLGIYLSI